MPIQDVLQGYFLKEEGERGKFEEDHWEYFTDLNFSHFIFAACTSLYLKTNTATLAMKTVLAISLRIKYIFVQANPDWAKFERYYRAIMNIDDRGIINCLYRETKLYCNCMGEKKREADGMAKLEKCTGCKHSFPRADMTKCSGCEYALYCTQDCQTKYWPTHKELCEPFQKVDRYKRRHHEKQDGHG